MTVALFHPEEPHLTPSYAEPVVKWAGGKRGLRRELLGLRPNKYSAYFEPFLGGGAFFLALAPARAVLNDANAELIEVYRALRDIPESVMEELDLMQPSVLDEDFYYDLRATSPGSLPLARRAARLIFLNKTCYNGLYRVNRAGEFNVPFGRYAKPPALYNRANLLRVTELLKQAELKSVDFSAALADAHRGDFAYLDPPYVPLSHTASFTRYTKGAFDEQDQRRLADAVHDLVGRGCNVLLSNSDTSLVRELYSAYWIDVVYAPRNINSDAGGRQKIRELAIHNYRLI